MSDLRCANPTYMLFFGSFLRLCILGLKRIHASKKLLEAFLRALWRLFARQSLSASKKHRIFKKKRPLAQAPWA